MLRGELTADCAVLGTDDLDAGALHGAGSASETWLASRNRLPLWIRRGCLPLGHGIVNWARFERFKVTPKLSST